MEKSELLKEITDTSAFGYEVIRDCIDASENISEAIANLESIIDNARRAIDKMDTMGYDTELTD